MCAHHDQKKVGSCGLYKAEDGEVGQVVRYQDKLTLRVTVAQTGKNLQTKVLSSRAPKCPATKLWTTGTWGWTIIDKVADEHINKYATAVAKQPVE